MTITAADPWRSPPRISRAGFASALNRAASPAAFERDPGAYWDFIVGRGVDPLYILGQFDHESNLGTQGVATRTRSWGNTRAPSFGIGYEPRTVPGRSGVFPVFLTWMDGLVTTVERYLAPTWYYHDRASIGEIFIQPLDANGNPAKPVWAPAGDLNDPDGYLAGVLAYMNAHAEGGTTVADPWDRIHLSADQGPDRPVADVRWFVVHDTEGSFPGDESVLTSAAPPVESVHFLVGRVPGQCVYSVPITATAWTAGNDQVSRQAIQVELSRNPANGETDYTEYQYAKLAEIFRWCAGQGMGVPAVYIGRVDADGGPEPDLPGIIGHQDVPDGAGGWGGSSHHTDPGPTFDWNRLVSLIGAGQPAPAPAGEPEWFQDGNPYGRVPIKGLFWARYNFLETTRAGLGLATYGYAKRPEQFTNGRWMQQWERGWMGTQKGSDPFNVVSLFPEEYPQ